MKTEAKMEGRKYKARSTKSFQRPPKARREARNRASFRASRRNEP